LISENEIEPITEEEKLQLESLRNELEELETIYDNAENPEELTDIVDRISEIEQEIEDIKSKQDIYEIVPGGYSHYGLTMFEHGGAEYAVGTESETQEAAKEAVRNLLDDIGIEGFNGGFVENFIDEDEVENYIRNFFDYDVRENPDVYLDDEYKELSRSQEKEIIELQEEERNVHQQIQSLQEEKNNLDDESEDLEEDIDEKISELEERISEIDDEIEQIKDNPDGDYSEEGIESMIDEMVSDYTRNPENFVSNYIGTEYMEWLKDNNMIDEDAFIDGIVDSDGYGTALNTYDGSYDVVNVQGTDYYVMRTN
jgi:phage shock protein A